MRIIKLKEAPVFPAPPPSKKVTKILIDPVSGSRHVAMGFTTYGIGEKGSVHSHTGEESIFIIKGRAGVTDASGKKQIAEAGDLIYVPVGEAHSIENVGEEELQFLWAYTPPGDEKAIRERGKAIARS